MTTVAKGSIGTAAYALTANTVDTVTFTGMDLPVVEVISPPSNTADIWYTLDGTTPAVNGAKSYYLPAGGVDSRRPTTAVPTVVKLISAGTPTVRVQKGD